MPDHHPFSNRSVLRPWSSFDRLVDELATLHGRARAAAARSVDEMLTLRSWLIGVWIVAFEQDGADRAAYGEGLLDALAAEFKRRGVTGLGASNLKNCRQLALTWPRLGIRQTASGEILPPLPELIRQTPSADLVPALPARSEPLPWQDDAWQARLRQELSFSHLLELSRVQEPLARAFYEVQALAQRWSVRELKRQRESMLFERVGLSRDKAAVLALAEQGHMLDTPAAIIRDPYVLEFLGLSERETHLEADLEASLIDHLQAFLLELGGDFAFLGRQYRITVGGRHHFIDLLFFHRRLRCLIAVDLKIGSFGHEDAGQMNFYLSYLRDNVALDDESDPIGIVLCADKDAEEVHYATGTLDNQVFVSRYLTRLPTEEQLRTWLADEKERLARRQTPN
ncbi:MAG: DUF1016 family protein [Xanthomonadales bacterium]|nr:DUF1016 family protein [Xanthomonadales bacterium]